MRTGIITAMDSEYGEFVSLIPEAKKRGKDIVLHKCGIGKVNAAAETFDFIQTYRPDIIISTGVAGGCSDLLEIADVVCAEKVVYHDVWCGRPNALGQIQGMPEYFVGDREAIDKIKHVGLEDVKFGTTLTGDWFVDTVEKMREIKNNFPDATAVDMESAAIAQVCYKMSVPFVSLRVISDIPLKGNNHVQYENFWIFLTDKSFSVAKKIILSL